MLPRFANTTSPENFTEYSRDSKPGQIHDLTPKRAPSIASLNSVKQGSSKLSRDCAASPRNNYTCRQLHVQNEVLAAQDQKWTAQYAEGFFSMISHRGRQRRDPIIALLPAEPTLYDVQFFSEHTQSLARHTFRTLHEDWHHPTTAIAYLWWYGGDATEDVVS
ncbi:uncharacterized protein BDW70DRAFT_141261 [Aspergillus foveolatus]|uniref:uncharacterized protein n=1 Tax=Aspergillus foveolatus TaxID=210207 RepID=UPI003CCD6334